MKFDGATSSSTPERAAFDAVAGVLAAASSAANPRDIWTAIVERCITSLGASGAGVVDFDAHGRAAVLACRAVAPELCAKLAELEASERRTDSRNGTRHFTTLGPAPGRSVPGVLCIPISAASGARGALVLLFDAESPQPCVAAAEALASAAALVMDREHSRRALDAERGAWPSGPAVFFQWRNAPGLPVVYVSPNVRDVFGYSARDLVGGNVSFLDIVAEDDRERLCAEVRAVEGSGATLCSHSYRVRRADGALVKVHDSSRIVRDAEGDATHFVGYLLDDSWSSDSSLQNESRIHMLFTQAVVGMAEVTLDGRFVMVNPRLCEMFGYSQNEFLRMTWRDVTAREEVSGNEKLQQRLLSGADRSFTLDKTYVRKDGSRISGRVTVGLLRNRAGQPERFISVVEDVTERRIMAEKLAQAQKMESLGRLAGGIAHDFNNMLTAITGYASLLSARQAPSSPDRAFTDQIRSAADSAAALTRQLLAFARKQVVVPTPVAINAAVERSLPILSRLIKSDIRIITDLAPGLWETISHPSQVDQALINLCTNAQDAMPEGGVLTVRTRNVTRESADGRALEYAALSVHDTGVGMTEEIRTRVFEPFFTTKSEGRGTGLGLASVYGILKQWGGEAEVISTSGAGSTFTLLWPRSTGPASTPEPTEAPTQRSHAPRARGVLVVEDEAAVRSVMVEAIRRAGFTTFEASNGIEAMELLAAGRAPLVKLVVSDVVMPEMGGLELAERLRAEHPSIAVLLVTGYSEEPVAERVGAGVKVLAKPFALDELLSSVGAALEPAHVPG